MNSLSDVLQLMAVAAVVAWAVWKVWRQGVREAKQFDAEQRRDQGLCPECGYDVRGGTGDRCPECGADLREPEPAGEPSVPEATLDPRKLAHDWPATPIEPVAPHSGAELAPLHVTRIPKEAGLLQEHLLARGVWCRLEQRQEYATAGAVSVRYPVYAALVPPDDLARAEAILDRFRLHGGGPRGGRPAGPGEGPGGGPTIGHGEVHDPAQRG
jgi:hypothetical protein